MKRCLLGLALLLLVACGAAEDQASPTLPFLPTVTSPPPATPTPEQDQAGYPAPTVVRAEPGYPAPAATPTLSSVYLDQEPIWVQKAAGMQCQEYEIDLEQARQELVQADVQVFRVELIALAVCEACDICASSEHYRAQIPLAELPAAVELGWSEAE